MNSPDSGGYFTTDVVVPSFRRPHDLSQCLAALAAQEHMPERVLVALRSTDTESHGVVEQFASLLPAEVVGVYEPGVIAAMTAAVSASTADVVAFTDDDARPPPDWLSLLLAHLSSPRIGGVGGRDVIVGQEGPRTTEVGIFRRSGRIVGNHHLGQGRAREVDVLKGVNMAFRAEALALPRPGVLRGLGAQVHFEILVSGWARRQGWRLVYDPEIVVDHAVGVRHGADRRSQPRWSAVFDAAYNLTTSTSLIATRAVPRTTTYGLVAGSRAEPGLGRAGVALLRGETQVFVRAPPALAGHALGVLRALQGASLNEVMVAAKALQVNEQRVRPGDDLGPKVALVAHGMHDRGGMERACAELIRHLHPHVRFVVVATELAPDLEPLIERWVRIRPSRGPFPLRFVSFFVLGGLALRRLRPDLVQTVGAIVPNKADIATIHFCHAGARRALGSLVPQDMAPLRRFNTTVSRTLALLAERWCYRPSRLSRFVGVSAGVAREVTRHYGGIPACVIPNGVDLETYRPDPKSRSDQRRAQGATEAIVALFVGGDWHRKGLAVAIKALAKARIEDPRLLLWVVGPGDVPRFQRLATEAGVPDSVRFFGARDDAERFFQAADMFVLPTLYETFSLVTYEAAASGLPIVSSAVSGIEDLIGDGQAGFMVNRTPDGVATAMVTLARDPMRRKQMGAEARRRAQNFSWDCAAAMTERMYADLVSSKKHS